jgi:aspartate kinase
VVSVASYTVLKFGGTSLSDAAALEAAAHAVALERRHRGVVAVVSAPRGVTDLLLACAAGTVASHERALASIRDQILTTAARVVDSAVELDELERTADRLLADARRALETAGADGASPGVRDAVAATGERLSAPLFAAALRRFGIDAEAVDAGDVIVTDAEHGDAIPNLGASADRARAILDPIVDHNCVPVVPGFVGAAPCGRTTTLGRGGSDLTAALIAVAGDTAVTFLKDVDGVQTADPNVVQGARTVPAISFAELCELACFGGRVIQYRAARLLALHRVPVTIRGLYESDSAGTTVGASGAVDGAIRAVTLAGGRRCRVSRRC